MSDTIQIVQTFLRYIIYNISIQNFNINEIRFFIIYYDMNTSEY